MKFKIGIFIIAFFFIFGLLMNIYINTGSGLAQISDKIIRLHVIANSDSPFDQQLKLQVRDKVIESMRGRLEGLKSVSEARSILASSLGEIEAVAGEAVKNGGKLYDVKATLEKTNFPTKAYGSLTFPAGQYQALNIVIGEGEGKNWWCVMFPPLCFIDVAHGVVPEKSMEELKASLTVEEYNLLLSRREPEKLPVKLRLKIVELVESVNMKLAGMMKSKEEIIN